MPRRSRCSSSFPAITREILGNIPTWLVGALLRLGLCGVWLGGAGADPTLVRPSPRAAPRAVAAGTRRAAGVDRPLSGVSGAAAFATASRESPICSSSTVSHPHRRDFDRLPRAPDAAALLLRMVLRDRLSGDRSRRTRVHCGSADVSLAPPLRPGGADPAGLVGGGAGVVVARHRGQRICTRSCAHFGGTARLRALERDRYAIALALHAADVSAETLQFWHRALLGAATRSSASRFSHSFLGSSLVTWSTAPRAGRCADGGRSAGCGHPRHPRWLPERDGSSPRLERPAAGGRLYDVWALQRRLPSRRGRESRCDRAKLFSGFARR